MSVLFYAIVKKSESYFNWAIFEHMRNLDKLEIIKQSLPRVNAFDMNRRNLCELSPLKSATIKDQFVSVINHCKRKIVTRVGHINKKF